MKELLLTIVKQLVDKPDEVQVNEIRTDEGKEVLFELTVAESDMGKVIGRQGRIARAIRTVMKAASVRENVKVNVEIL